MRNHFHNSPTVGSHDTSVSNKALHERIVQLENQLREAQVQARQREEEKPRRFKWGRIGKFFNKFIKPVVDTITRLLNAIANYRKAFA